MHKNKISISNKKGIETGKLLMIVTFSPCSWELLHTVAPLDLQELGMERPLKVQLKLPIKWLISFYKDILDYVLCLNDLIFELFYGTNCNLLYAISVLNGSSHLLCALVLPQDITSRNLIFLINILLNYIGCCSCDNI